MLKLTVKGNGWVFIESVNANVSIGEEGIWETWKPQRRRAVLMNTDLQERETVSYDICNQNRTLYLDATCWPGQMLAMYHRYQLPTHWSFIHSPSAESEWVHLSSIIDVAILRKPTLRIKLLGLSENCRITADGPVNRIQAASDYGRFVKHLLLASDFQWHLSLQVYDSFAMEFFLVE